MAKGRNIASRGFVNDTILEALMAGDKYGYEIIKEVEEKSNGKVVLKQPSLYSSLRRFESKGYISSYWGDSDIGGRRHYYSITDTGRQYFNSKNGSENEEDVEETETEENSPIVEEESIEESVNKEEKTSYDLDETVIAEEIPVVSDKYVNSFRDFNLEDKVNELLGEEAAEKENREEKQPRGLYNTVNKDTDDLEYIREQEDAKQKNEDEPIEEEIETEEKVYLQNNKVIENIDIEKVSTALSETEFVKEETKPAEEKKEESPAEIRENDTEKKRIPLVVEEEEDVVINLDELRKQALKNTESFSKTTLSESQLKQEIDKKREAEREEKYKQQDMFNAPVKKQYNVITDEDGITKAASDCVSSNKEQKVFDNVGVRLSPFKTYNPLGSEEDEDKVEDDLPEFEEEKDEVEEAKEINYKQILGDLYESDGNKSSEHKIISNPFEKQVIEEEKQEFKPAARVEEAPTEPEEIEVRTFKPKHTKEKEYDFILYNKARGILALFLSLFAIMQISAFLIIIQAKGLTTTTDTVVFITGLSLAILGLLIFAAPWFLKPNRRKLETFNFKLNLLFCSLAFLAISIVVYAINTLFGLNGSNVSQYSSTLFLPIILAFNIVLAPTIYIILTINNNMYY